MIGSGNNALASSIILVCRPRQANAGTISRRQFVWMLDAALPLALDAMTRASEGLHSPVAPVDLSQAIIGPGMAIFSRYDAVLEADGRPPTSAWLTPWPAPRGRAWRSTRPTGTSAPTPAWEALHRTCPVK